MKNPSKKNTDHPFYDHLQIDGDDDVPLDFFFNKAGFLGNYFKK